MQKFTNVMLPDELLIDFSKFINCLIIDLMDHNHI